MNRTRIAKGMWWDRAWTVVEGCTPVSRACEHCWAASATHMRAQQKNARIHARYEGLTGDNRRFNGKIRLMHDSLTVPLHVKQPMSWAVWNDLFHEDVSFDFIDRVFAVMAFCPRHTFQVLTKRPERGLEYMNHYQPGRYIQRGGVLIPGTSLAPYQWPLPNVWLGTSIEDQATADERIPHLLQCPAAFHFVSDEPALGPVDFLQVAAGPICPQNPQHRIDVLRGGTWNLRSGLVPPNQPEFINHSDMPATLDWVIAGGETGPGARPAHPDWFRTVRDQCVEAGVLFFFKQWGEWWPQEQGQYMAIPLTDGMSDEAWVRLGKKRAGRLLDGRTWDQMPQQQGAGSRE